jgi:ribose 5-phosphate isomerase B
MILIASDHAGVAFKAELIGHLSRSGHECHDLGAYTDDSVDYPDIAHDLARRVAAGEAELGILVCGTGIGMSMAANRHRGVRAALCHDGYTAAMARRHNNANVLCLGARILGAGVAEDIVDTFLRESFEGARHQRRVSKIDIE